MGDVLGILSSQETRGHHWMYDAHSGWFCDVACLSIIGGEYYVWMYGEKEEREESFETLDEAFEWVNQIRANIIHTLNQHWNGSPRITEAILAVPVLAHSKKLVEKYLGPKEPPARDLTVLEWGLWLLNNLAVDFLLDFADEALAARNYLPNGASAFSLPSVKEKA